MYACVVCLGTVKQVGISIASREPELLNAAVRSITEFSTKFQNSNNRNDSSNPLKQRDMLHLLLLRAEVNLALHQLPDALVNACFDYYYCCHYYYTINTITVVTITTTYC